MNVAVLGAGADGRDIASLCARAGHGVALSAEDATRAMDRIDEIERDLADSKITDETKAATLGAIEATTDLEAAVSGVDVVVESSLRDTEQLQARFAEIETVADPETLITTSAERRVTTAAAGLRRPGRALGVQFFDLPESEVAELIVASQTTEAAAARAESFLETLGATPIRVADAPGEVSTRVELAMEAEAMRAVADGIGGVEGVDTLMSRGYHHSMGPLERADRTGLDDRLERLRALADALGDRFEPPDLLAELVADGNTGLAAGSGFYRWEGGEPVESALDGPAIPTREEPFDDPTRP